MNTTFRKFEYLEILETIPAELLESIFLARYKSCEKWRLFLKNNLFEMDL